MDFSKFGTTVNVKPHFSLVTEELPVEPDRIYHHQHQFSHYWHFLEAFIFNSLRSMVSTDVFVKQLQQLISNIFRHESATWRTNWSCTGRAQSEFAHQLLCSASVASVASVQKFNLKHRLNIYFSALHQHTHVGNGLVRKVEISLWKICIWIFM